MSRLVFYVSMFKQWDEIAQKFIRIVMSRAEKHINLKLINYIN